MTISVEQNGNQYLLFPQGENGVAAELFDTQRLAQRGVLLQRQMGGRASVCFFLHRHYEMVLREYRRGGAMAKISQNRYLWTGLQNSRPWRELALLTELRMRQLPVPAPYAAMLVKEGFFYRAALITYRLAETITFAERLRRSPAPEWLWLRVGGVIRQMHDQNVYHSDLNANNILINSDNAVFIIDFDKSEIRKKSDNGWKFKNLERLHRSLKKIHAGSEVFHYSAKAWGVLARGYAGRAGSRRAASIER